MIHIFVNAGSASAGGGLTYLRNLVAQLRRRNDVRATILTSDQARGTLSLIKNECSSAHVSFLRYPWAGPAALRCWREQWALPRMIRSCGADVLLSTGNVALRNSPVPQILLSRNALYSTPEFFRDLRARRKNGQWIMEACKGGVAKRSLRWADCTIAPSRAFATELQAHTGRDVMAIHHGFDASIFFASPNIPEVVHRKLKTTEGCARLLFVSHYNYYRNFETLLRALPLIRRQLAPKPVRLFLTCHLSPERDSGSYTPGPAAALLEELGIADEVVQLGAIPYESLHHLYRACDMYVTAAYAESFAHPLVEAMASGLPVVASDLPVHREIAGDAARYVPPFSPAAFAEEIAGLMHSPERRRQMGEAGRRRSRDFSWVDHVEQIVAIARHLASPRPLQMPAPATVPS